MRKLILTAMVALACIFMPTRSHALQFTLPQITALTTSYTNASVTLSTPTQTNVMNCIQHITAETNANAAQLNYLSNGATIDTVILSSGVPYDSQWFTQGALCGTAGNQMTISVSAGTYTVSVEAFTTKGWAP